MAAYDHARVVDPQHENVMLFKVVVAIDPVLQRQIREHVVALRYEDRLLDRRFRWLVGAGGKAIVNRDCAPPRPNHRRGQETNRTKHLGTRYEVAPVYSLHNPGHSM